MIQFKLGSRLEDDFLGVNEDAINIFTINPLVGIIPLRKMTKNELMEFSSELKVTYTKINDLPILVFIFKSYYFEAPMSNINFIDREDEENIINLILVTAEDKIIRSTRIISLKTDFIKLLKKDIEKNQNKSEAELLSIYMKIQNKYTTEDIINKAKIVQIFEGI